jgi:hypothetical protein
VNNVDIAAASKLTLPTCGWSPDFSRHPGIRAAYRHEP